LEGLYLTLVVQALIPTLYTTLRIYLLGDIPEVGSTLTVLLAVYFAVGPDPDIKSQKWLTNKF
jgi:hypothetical protein